MCRCSALFVVGVLVLVIASLACGLGFAAPFWMAFDDSIGSNFMSFFSNFMSFFSNFMGFVSGNKLRAEGLWALCYGDDTYSIKDCAWYFKDDFKAEKELPDWHKASQGLFGVGLLLIWVGLLIGIIQMCVCCCCKESSAVVSTLGSLCISGACLITASLGVWGGYITKESRYKYQSFYWAFFVAIGGAAAAVVAAVLFFCENCRAKNYEGYRMTRVV